MNSNHYGKKPGEKPKPSYRKEQPSFSGQKRTPSGQKHGAEKDPGPGNAEEAPGKAPDPVMEDELPLVLMGRNAVREALRSGKSINRILVVREKDGSLGELIGLARNAGIDVREADRKKLDEICMPFGHGGKTGNHQGIVAYVAGVDYCTVADILQVAADRNEAPFIVVLDGIEDPHNLGSIIRSAECAGAHGVIIGKRRSASVTAAAVKTSAGAAEYMHIARVVNISSALAELKKNGLWVAGADMRGATMSRQNLTGPLALVIGSEGAGLSKLVKDSCDFLVSIPMFGRIDSLNAGVAAGILLFEKKRQDLEKAHE